MKLLFFCESREHPGTQQEYPCRIDCGLVVSLLTGKEPLYMTR